MTELIETIAALRAALAPARLAAQSIGLVPTMGALHAGHVALIERARRECERVVVTLFVNKLQFNQASDFERYPRTLDADLAACSLAGADFLFAPSQAEMYPSEPLAFVEVERLTEGLCGAFRPGHFRGVTTVCAKLFHIAGADRAYFGEKDYQQLAVIRRMARDLDFPLEIVGVPTVREPDGLAMSSRNARLSPAERAAAAALWRAIEAARQAFAVACARPPACWPSHAKLWPPSPRAARVCGDRRPGNARALDRVQGDARLALAVWIGEVRLIDNAPLG